MKANGKTQWGRSSSLVLFGVTLPIPSMQVPSLNFRYTVQQALRVKWRVFGVFVCFGLYFVNYRSWQAEILQERAEGCIQVDPQKKIRQT